MQNKCHVLTQPEEAAGSCRVLRLVNDSVQYLPLMDSETQDKPEP